MHAPAEGSSAQDLGEQWVFTEIDHRLLDGQLKNEDYPEHGVMEWRQGLEDVDALRVEQPAIDLIEHVHQNESVEAHGVEGETVSLLVKLLVVEIRKLPFDEIWGLVEEGEAAEIHQVGQNQDLVEGLDKNLPPHLWEDDFLTSADSDAWLRWVVRFSANGDGSQNVHDEVCPEHLDDVERGMAHGGSAQNGNEDNGDVDGQLELQELPNIIEDRPAPFERLVDRYEVVVEDDQVRVLFRNVTAAAHAKSDVSILEGLSVRDALAGHSDQATLLPDS